MKVTMTSLVFLLLFATVVVKANRDSPCNSSNNNERVRTNNDSVQLVAVSSMNESNKRAGSAVDVSRSTSVNDQDLPLALTYRKLSARSYLSLCQQFSHLLPYILESLSKSLLLLDGKLIAVSAKKVRPDSDNAGNDGSMPLKNSYVWWELPLRKNIFNVHFMQIEQNHVVSLNHKLLGIEYAFRSEGSGKGAPLKPTYRGRDVEITDQESFSVTLKKIKVGTVTAPEIVAQKDTLIVLTTCNHLDTTIFALQYLRDTRDYADLLIVDDYSVDGTTEYLTKKGKISYVGLVYCLQ